MNSLFYTYFQLGFQHILDLNAYDHLIFIVALCALYKVADWRKILILITAFTIGHSLTLILAALDIIRFPSLLIEALIPITIILTATYNLLPHHQVQDQSQVNVTALYPHYLMALLFGLIHGMGFSNQFKALLMKDQSIIALLFPFNIGIEAGQLLIVGAVMLVSYICLNILRVSHQAWIRVISFIAGGLAISLLYNVLTGG